MTTLLLYSPIYSFTVEAFVENLNQVPDNEDVLIRLNSPGGSLFAGWSLISALKDREGKFNLRVEGNASSMAFFFSLYADKVEALDVTRFMVHRADGYVESDEDKNLLISVNKDLRAKLSARINEDKFKDVTGVTYDELFDINNRKDVWMTAKEAKKIGLVDKIVKLDPVKFAAEDSRFVGFDIVNQIESNNNNKKKEFMNKVEFKASHNAIYDEIIADGSQLERDRVNAWMQFIDIDAEAVKKGIDEGKQVTQNVIAEMARKAISAQLVANAEKDSAQKTDTSKDEKKEDKTDPAVEKFEADILAAAGLTVKMEGK